MLIQSLSGSGRLDYLHFEMYSNTSCVIKRRYSIVHNVLSDCVMLKTQPSMVVVIITLWDQALNAGFFVLFCFFCCTCANLEQKL